MHVPDIIEVKKHMDELVRQNLIAEWELPYENLLTRRSAAIFFLNPSQDNLACLQKIWDELTKYENFSQRVNEERKLSAMKYRVTFSKDEYDKNQNLHKLLTDKIQANV